VNFAVGPLCERCHRVIAKDDWIDRQAEVEVIAGVMIHRFRHVGCRPPKATQKTLRKTAPALPFETDAPDPGPPDPARPTRFEVPGAYRTWVDQAGGRHAAHVGAHSIDLAWPWLLRTG